MGPSGGRGDEGRSLPLCCGLWPCWLEHTQYVPRIVFSSVGHSSYCLYLTGYRGWGLFQLYKVAMVEPSCKMNPFSLIDKFIMQYILQPPFWFLLFCSSNRLMVSRARERMGVSLLTTLSSSRCSYYFLINIKCAASNLVFTNPMTLFSMQGPKVKISINSTNSPAVGNSKVVKQGELLNQDSYHPC